VKRALLLLAILAACGDNDGGPLTYANPHGGKLRLVTSKTPPASDTEVVLDLVVGDQPLTGYSVGFNLPLDHTRVRLAGFEPGSALNAGATPQAALARQPVDGPLADMLVTGLSQKASGGGAVATDTALAPEAVLYTIHLQLVQGAANGVVFDGTAADFHLPSGGLRDRAGTTVVEPMDVAIGRLVVHH
jgi:hypothetical protein